MSAYRRPSILALAIALLNPARIVFAEVDLRITEVDYNQPGMDTAEWIELKSNLDVPQMLEGFNLVFYDGVINGTCAEYCRIDLAPLVWLNANEVIVIGNHPCAVLPLCSATEAIQNGTPDTITLEYFGEVVFALEYGSGSTISACSRVAAGWRTSAVDIETTPGSLQHCQHGWQFTEDSTPCTDQWPPCPPTDVLPPAGNRATNYLASGQPNPFNPRTIIEYSIEAASRVRLSIYDARGTPVRLLVNGLQQEGVHHVEWDGTAGTGNRLASGIYMVQIVAGEFRQTRKLVLLQ